MSDPERPGHVVGDTNLFLIGYDDENGKYTEVDPGHDMVMAFLDGRFIIRQLVRVSRKFGVSWVLEIEGGTFGVIENGRTTMGMRLQVIALGLFARFQGRTPSLWLSSLWLRRKHSRRWSDSQS